MVETPAAGLGAPNPGENVQVVVTRQRPFRPVFPICAASSWGHRMVPEPELRCWITLKSATHRDCAICSLIPFPFQSVIKFWLISEELGPRKGELYVWVTVHREWKCVEAKCDIGSHQAAAHNTGGRIWLLAVLFPVSCLEVLLENPFTY